MLLPRHYAIGPIHSGLFGAALFELHGVASCSSGFFLLVCWLKEVELIYFISPSPGNKDSCLVGLGEAECPSPKNGGGKSLCSINPPRLVERFLTRRSVCSAGSLGTCFVDAALQRGRGKFVITARAHILGKGSAVIGGAKTSLKLLL